MRRTKLVWFAFGAAAVALVTILAKLLEPQPEQPIVAFLELTEPFEMGEVLRNEDSIANRTGQLARDCGARFFETTFLYSDHQPTMEIALTQENEEAVRCLLSNASKHSIPVNIIFRKATNAQAH